VKVGDMEDFHHYFFNLYFWSGCNDHSLLLIFNCAEKKLVLELDGNVHEYQRDLVLNSLGLNTLRIVNDELRDLENLKRKILNELV